MFDDAFSWLIPDQIYTRKRKSGVSSPEILTLPDALRQLVNHVMHHEPVQLQELIDALERPADDVEVQLTLLTAQGWLQAKEIEGETHYCVPLTRRRTRRLPPGIWQVLEDSWDVQLLRYLNNDEKADFTHAFKLEHFEAGQHIFTKGDWGRSMYLIDAGLVELVTHDADGRKVVLARLKPGDIIGEVAVLLGERRWATARAVESVSVWTLHKDDLDRLLARSPSAGLSIRREIERRVRGLDWRTLALSSGHRPPEQLNPLLSVGPGTMELAQALSGYTGERLLVLDLHPSPLPSPPRPSALDFGKPESRQPVEQRPAHHLDSEELADALHQSLDEFDRVIVAAPTELHSPLLGIIDLIELVIDLSATQAPWVVAAARHRWTIPGGRDASSRDIEHIARRLCRRVVGLALSGGGARALAHIGVLKALEEAQLPFDMIASTGMGAVVAGLYAAGFSVDELTDLAVQRGRDLNPFDGSLNLRLASRAALYAGKRARNALNKLLKGRTFADLRLPLYVVAADLESGQPVILDQGPLADAMEASLALAGLVAPAEISDKQSLVDGGLINPMPADILAERGADLIVGVSTIPCPAGRLGAHVQVRRDTSPLRGQTDLTNTWMRLRDQLAYTALMDNLRYLDMLIMPQVDQFDGTAFDRAAELIAAGLAVTQREIDYLRTLTCNQSVMS
jgi:predicted acylesterase/phospholipase RssA